MVFPCWSDRLVVASAAHASLFEFTVTHIGSPQCPERLPPILRAVTSSRLQRRSRFGMRLHETFLQSDRRPLWRLLGPSLPSQRKERSFELDYQKDLSTSWTALVHQLVLPKSEDRVRFGAVSPLGTKDRRTMLESAICLNSITYFFQSNGFRERNESACSCVAFLFFA
jgi:hypothetical protein